MPLSNIKRLKDLTAADAEVANEVALSINQKINGLRGTVKEKLMTLFNGGLAVGAGALNALKEFDEKLTKSDTVKAAFETDVLRTQFRDSFVETLDTRFGPTAAPADTHYNFSETKDAIRATVNSLMGQTPAPAVREEPEENDADEPADEESSGGHEAPPRYQKSSWKFWTKDFWTSEPYEPKTGETMQPLKRRALLAGGTLGLAGTLAAAETGAVIGQFPIISTLSSIGATTKAALAAIPALNASTTLLGVPLSIPPVAAAVVPTALAVGGLWAAGRTWEAIQRNWLKEKVPERSFSNRVWEGLKLLPYTLPKRFGTLAVTKAWEHKASLGIGAGIGIASAVTFGLSPAGALVIGALAAGARIALSGSESHASAEPAAGHA
ncbi:MAG: hypothetical protein HOO67_03285 [Candidatus Peribacteraceae bacterium]|nr:hypothetical protein [Candidatus Peribacteraceae bacterium]